MPKVPSSERHFKVLPQKTADPRVRPLDDTYGEKEQKDVVISSGRVAYWTYGNSKKPHLVLVHGFTGDHHGFQKLIPLLYGDYYVIVPDLPGSGISDLQPEHQWNINDLAQLTNEFVAALNLSTPPLLLGHSMGGLVAASMVHHAPQLYAQKIILLSPVPTKINLLSGRWLGAWLSDLQYYFGHKVPVLGPKLIKSRWLTKFIAGLLITTKNKELIDFTHQQMLNNLNYISSIKYYYKLSKDINRRGAIDYAGELIKKDLLIINGDIDRVVPLAEMEKLVKATGAHLTLIEGVGHDIHYEQPEQAVQAIKTFLTN